MFEAMGVFGVFCLGLISGCVVILVIIAGLMERHLQEDSEPLKLSEEDRAALRHLLDINNTTLQDILEENKKIWAAIQVRWPK